MTITLTPLDEAILKQLPEEGSMLGYHHLATQTAQIVSALNESLPKGVPPITSAGVNGRLRSLKHRGLVADVPVMPSNNGVGWQRTKEAK